MNKRENLILGTKYANAAGEKAFTGSRIEGGYRVTTFVIEVPYTDDITGEVFYVKDTRKISVPNNSLPADYSTALEKCNAYMDQEVTTDIVSGVAQRAAIAAGAIELVIDDIA